MRKKIKRRSILLGLAASGLVVVLRSRRVQANAVGSSSLSLSRLIAERLLDGAYRLPGWQTKILPDRLPANLPLEFPALEQSKLLGGTIHGGLFTSLYFTTILSPQQLEKDCDAYFETFS